MKKEEAEQAVLNWYSENRTGNILFQVNRGSWI